MNGLIWNKTKECMSAEDRYKLQSARLVKQVKRVYHQVPFYREKMQQMGLEPGDIKGLEDLEKLPFTTKADLRDHYPFGLFAVPQSEIVRLHASSGTTGKPTVVGYTRGDIECWQECVARCLTMAGVTQHDKVQVAYGYGLFTGGLGLHYGVENLGAMVIPISTSHTQKQLQLMEDFGTTVIACTPSYLGHLMDSILEAGIKPNLQLKTAICGAEPWTEELRTKIQNGLGIELFDIYGLSEIMGPGVSQDCEAHQGSHVMDDYFLPELLDPDTLQAVPDGEVGELVITTLTKEALPLLRYRTHDLTSITHEPCSCGRTSARIARFRGRSDDMLIIRGVNVFPSQIEAALMQLGETKPHYQIILEREGNMDTFDILIEVEERFFSDEVAELERLSHKVSQTLSQALGLHPTVHLVEPGTIERSEGKARRVIDKRRIYVP